MHDNCRECYMKGFVCKLIVAIILDWTLFLFDLLWDYYAIFLTFDKSKMLLLGVIGVLSYLDVKQKNGLFKLKVISS